ncbi:hypothetical protein TSUD_54880 [Trifolium subterraneum]|uniref:TF-B3 domain-containing protein n=1 Tax=Trifolium subterraneum TaxID=3900 RepID=A0A2Z6NFT6_TRISU|nr:hypothetical protein TSUD_54880 [Trifolium subterraneum]
MERMLACEPIDTCCIVGLPFQNLRGMFADFIKHFYQRSLRISADNGENYYCAVVRKRRDPIWTVELGYNINYLCRDNNFEGGDLIRFKFDVDLRCHACKIIKSDDDN